MPKPVRNLGRFWLLRNVCLTLGDDSLRQSLMTTNYGQFTALICAAQMEKYRFWHIGKHYSCLGILHLLSHSSRVTKFRVDLQRLSEYSHTFSPSRVICLEFSCKMKRFLRAKPHALAKACKFSNNLSLCPHQRTTCCSLQTLLFHHGGIHFLFEFRSDQHTLGLLP